MHLGSGLVIKGRAYAVEREFNGWSSFPWIERDSKKLGLALYYDGALQPGLLSHRIRP